MESNSTLPSVLAPATQSHDPDDILRDPEAGSPFFEASITAMSSQDRRPGLGSDGSMHDWAEIPLRVHIIYFRSLVRISFVSDLAYKYIFCLRILPPNYDGLPDRVRQPPMKANLPEKIDPPLPPRRYSQCAGTDHRSRNGDDLELELEHQSAYKDVQILSLMTGDRDRKDDGHRHADPGHDGGYPYRMNGCPEPLSYPYHVVLNS